MTAARAQDLAIGAGVMLLLVVVVTMAGFTVWQVLDDERARRARCRPAPPAKGDGGTLSGDGTPAVGAEEVEPSRRVPSSASMSDELAPCDLNGTGWEPTPSPADTHEAFERLMGGRYR